MAEFPCGICKTNCENDTIQCSECELWFHSKCLGMSKTSLKSWSVKTLNYYCGSCSFDGDLYDAGKALKRYLFTFIYLFIYLFISILFMEICLISTDI